MLVNNEFKTVCSVSELVGKLGLSRARFYELQKMGVFPAPLYCIHTKRPFYPLYLQQECVEIRKTGIGRNGQPVLFYAPRKDKNTELSSLRDPKHEELAAILKRMGLDVSPSKVSKAIEILYPDKLARRPIEGKIIRELFRYFEQRM